MRSGELTRLKPYSWFSPSTSRSFGHGPKGLDRFVVARAGQRDQARRGQSSLVDRRVRILLEVAQEPARSDPLVPARALRGRAPEEGLGAVESPWWEKQLGGPLWAKE
jgi:hypothetical protein